MKPPFSGLWARVKAVRPACGAHSPSTFHPAGGAPGCDLGQLLPGAVRYSLSSCDPRRLTDVQGQLLREGAWRG